MSLVRTDCPIKSSQLTDKSARSYLKELGRSNAGRISAQNAKFKSRLSMIKPKTAVASSGCKLTDLCPEDRERLADLVSHLSDVQTALEAANHQQLRSADLTAPRSNGMFNRSNCPGLDFAPPRSLVQNSPVQPLRLYDPSDFEGYQLTCQRSASLGPSATSPKRAALPPCSNLACNAYRRSRSLATGPAITPARRLVPAQQWNNGSATWPSNREMNEHLLDPTVGSRTYVNPAQYERQLQLLETELRNLRATLGGWTSTQSSRAPRTAGLTDAAYKYPGLSHRPKREFCVSDPASRPEGACSGASFQVESDRVSLETAPSTPTDPESNSQAEAAVDVMLSEKPFASMDDKPERLKPAAVGRRTCTVPFWEILNDETEEVESCAPRSAPSPPSVKPVALSPAPKPAIPKLLIDECVQMGEHKSSSENAVQTDPPLLESTQRNSNAVTEDTAAPETLVTQSSAYVSAATPSSTAQSPSIPVPVGTISSDMSLGRSLSSRPSDNLELKRLAATAQPGGTQRFTVHSPTSAFVAVSAKPRRLHLLCHKSSSKAYQQQQQQQNPSFRFRRQMQTDAGESGEVRLPKKQQQSSALSKELEEGLWLSQLLNNCKRSRRGHSSSRQTFSELGSLLSAEEEELFSELFFVN